MLNIAELFRLTEEEADDAIAAEDTGSALPEA